MHAEQQVDRGVGPTRGGGYLALKGRQKRGFWSAAQPQFSLRQRRQFNICTTTANNSTCFETVLPPSLPSILYISTPGMIAETAAANIPTAILQFPARKNGDNAAMIKFGEFSCKFIRSEVCVFGVHRLAQKRSAAEFHKKAVIR